MLSSGLGTQLHRELLQWLPTTLVIVQNQLTVSPWHAAASSVHRSSLVRDFRTTSGFPQHLQDRLVTAFIEDALSALSIPHGELGQLAAGGLSDAALTAWALTKTASHPAVQQAAAISQKLQQLLVKLDGAMLWQQTAASSPLGQLLWQVAVGAGGSEFAALDTEQLEGRVEAEVVQAHTREASQQHSPQLLQQVVQQLHHMTDTPPTFVIGNPDFWRLAKQVAAAAPALEQDLSLLGYDLPAAADVAVAQLQQLQQLTGVDAAALQQQLQQDPRTRGFSTQPGSLKQLLVAVAGDAAARKAVAQLALLQVLAQALGLTAVQVGYAAPSPCELVARLTGLAPAQHALSQQLQEQLVAAAPTLLAAVSQLPAAAVEQANVGSLMQLISNHQECKELFESLTAWRAEAAAAGWLPVLVTLSQSEVSGLSQKQAEALGRAMMQLEARGQGLLRKAAAQALPLGQLDAADAAALAWKLHTGGKAAAEALLKAVLNQASAVYACAVAELESAGSALSSMAVGFKLEDATARRSSAAPPSPLVLAGVPQHQIKELSKSLPSLGSNAQHGNSTSSRNAEFLIRDLALLLGTDVSPGSSLSSQAAAAQRLQIMSHDLPKVLSGPLLELVATYQQSSSVKDAAAARHHQQQLRAFVQALEVELPRMAAAAAATGSSNGCSSSSSGWSEAAAAAAGVSGAAAEGLLELLGEQDTAQLLAAAAAKRDDEQGEQGLYEMLADVHHDVDMQRYLQMEFDPALELDVVHAPHGWQGPDLLVTPGEFLDSMKPLLDQYLAAQGEAPVTELEWQVYRDAALAEHEQVELSAADSRRAAGHSPFNNSRADEAYLTQRLNSSIPQDSVLYAAAHKYLKASFKSRGWTFAQRKRLIDRLAEIAGHLAAHPPRMHRGSPFSALFQPDGPPAVPRLSRGKVKAGVTPGVEDSETYALPAGFGPQV